MKAFKKKSKHQYNLYNCDSHVKLKKQNKSLVLTNGFIKSIWKKVFTIYGDYMYINFLYVYAWLDFWAKNVRKVVMTSKKKSTASYSKSNNKEQSQDGVSVLDLCNKLDSRTKM